MPARGAATPVQLPPAPAYRANPADLGPLADDFAGALVPAWRSATGGVAGEDRYTAFGYANPTRRILGSVLLTHAELQEIETAAEFDPNENEGAALAYRSDVVELVEMVIYRPLLRPLQALVRGMKRLQSGRLDAYIAYMLVALIGVLAVVAAVS